MKITISVLEGISMKKNGTNGLNKGYLCGHGVNDFWYHGDNLYQYGSNGVLVQLGTVETYAAAELDILGTVISLTRGVGRRDVKIKTNILEITMQLDYSVVRLCIQCAINLWCIRRRASLYMFCFRLQTFLWTKKKHYRHTFHS